MSLKLPVFLFTATLLLVSSGSVFAHKPEFASKNQPSYWGDNCYKLEIDGDVKTYTVTDPEAYKVIVKGGTEHKVYDEGPFENLTAAYNKNSGKTYGISHVTICTDQDQSSDDDHTDNEQPVTPVDDGEVAGDTDSKPQPSDDAKISPAQTLPETGAPALINALFGGMLSAVAGTTQFLSSRRQKIAKRIEEIAL